MKINGKTELYGILGNPVSHSLSPAMHNAAFQTLGLNKAYLPFPASKVEDAINGFRALNIKGVSVTIPHKKAVIPYLDEIEPVAEKIGAVNTLVINENHVTGMNTDWLGANRALEQAINLKGETVLILGAGGSARAIGFGLIEAGAKIMIASRTRSSGEELANQLNCQWHKLSSVPDLSAAALVNATSVGMVPKSDISPVEARCLSKFPIIMDIVYAPRQTRLLKEASQAGCQTIDGLAMLLFQGAAQFEIWTGLKAPLDVMREQLLIALTKKK